MKTIDELEKMLLELSWVLVDDRLPTKEDALRPMNGRSALITSTHHCVAGLPASHMIVFSHLLGLLFAIPL
jgi:hypothetical protein